MADSMKIQGPVEVKHNSAERVAFDLMNIISANENPEGLDDSHCRAKKNSSRLYYLNLYVECIEAVKYQQVPAEDHSQE